ncbi:MAG: TonB-dependent receptor [Saprospiraceae bacterium]|nr:TonB-dependent receptor [Saprospiraceae bacterium]
MTIFGNIVFAKEAIPNLDKERKYYKNTGTKSDVSGYFRTNYSLNSDITFHGDIQLRNVVYEVNGIDNDLRNINIKNNNFFVNPKFGANWAFKTNQNLYASYAVANKEASRGDFIDNAFGAFPSSEHLTNLEFGYRMQKSKTSIESNVYYMKYKNQLVQTGKVNDVGAAIRINVPNSYRLG